MSQFCVKMCPGLVNIYRRDMCQICFDQKWIFVRKFHSVVNMVKSLKASFVHLQCGLPPSLSQSIVCPRFRGLSARMFQDDTPPTAPVTAGPSLLALLDTSRSITLATRTLRTGRRPPGPPGRGRRPPGPPGSTRTTAATESRGSRGSIATTGAAITDTGARGRRGRS